MNDLDAINESLQAAVRHAPAGSSKGGQFISSRGSDVWGNKKPRTGGPSHTVSKASEGKRTSRHLNVNPRGTTDGGNIPRSPKKQSVVIPKKTNEQWKARDKWSDEKHHQVATVQANRLEGHLNRSGVKFTREGNTFTASEGNVTARVQVGGKLIGTRVNNPRIMQVTIKHNDRVLRDDGYAAADGVARTVASAFKAARDNPHAYPPPPKVRKPRRRPT